MDADPRVTITTAVAELRSEALQLLVPPTSGHRSEAILEGVAANDPALASAGGADPCFADLLIAQRGRRVVGAAWVQPAPGKVAVVWPPRLVPAEPAATASRLMLEVDRRLVNYEIDLAQAVLPANDEQDARGAELTAHLRRHGFQPAARLLSMACEIGAPANHRPAYLTPADGPSGLPFELVPFNHAQTQRMVAVIERTYQQTLDIPALNGVRQPADVLDGYSQIAPTQHLHWFFARSNDADVGCLLLVDQRREDRVEVVYMGLAPGARGRGWGRQITEYAKDFTARLGRRHLVLGVDAANDPALMVYTAAGLHVCAERTVFVRPRPA